MSKVARADLLMVIEMAISGFEMADYATQLVRQARLPLQPIVEKWRAMLKAISDQTEITQKEYRVLLWWASTLLAFHDLACIAVSEISIPNPRLVELLKAEGFLPSAFVHSRIQFRIIMQLALQAPGADRVTHTWFVRDRELVLAEENKEGGA